MAIIEMPVTTEEINAHPIDVSDERGLVSTSKSTPTDSEDRYSTQVDGMAYSDDDSPEDATHDRLRENNVSILLRTVLANIWKARIRI